ncbi:thiamine diphosphokinase [Notoacmeibacter sp. MSK16QG-6]|uniref:thiamine diphosphokinase n=1 Tax=Notoacmeibacter sp. MSK16QG-6 TaxID=2957982 RepID=UPI00209F86B2|nr:thiamine diphosphokinase [Notoacmeibacter sp. MSK16QG-6]MCP1200182.1 thiamine diphosphokinase [Notoacmeibacter sp. MSK16QG-6]
MTRYALFLGGDMDATPRLMSQIAGLSVIAADSGMAHAERLGVTPELWVGDFDSVSPGDIERFGEVEIQRHPVDKDMTDGDLAFREAIRRGARSLLVVGAFGGPRLDHAMQITMAAIGLHEAGIDTVLTDGRQEGYPLRIGEENRFEFSEGTLFSILVFSDLKDLSVSGARWPLAEETIPFGSSRTLSNVAEGPLTITLSAGRGLLLVTQDVFEPAMTDRAVAGMIADAVESDEDAD